MNFSCFTFFSQHKVTKEHKVYFRLAYFVLPQKETKRFLHKGPQKLFGLLFSLNTKSQRSTKFILVHKFYIKKPT